MLDLFESAHRSGMPSTRFTNFHNLMRHRVNEILLVSSLYDSFILAQDGQLQEQVLNEFMQLNLYHTPGITRAAKASEALGIAANDPRYNLMIATSHVGDMHVADFARRAQERGILAPIALLAYDKREVDEILKYGNQALFDSLYIWQGDVRILLAIVKQVEDWLNVEHDTKSMGVHVILLVEDNIHFYSSYLPMLYGELLDQSQGLIAESVNTAHRIMRMRARPKVLHCTNFEDAWEAYRKYKDNLIGVITDIEYERQGEKDRNAGPELVQRIRSFHDDVPVVLQSFRQEIAEIANDLNVAFLKKDSPTLLHDLRQFMKENLGFGDFVFRNAEGTIFERAHDLRTLQEKMATIPAESLLYHAERNHFSNWLKARTEFQLAQKFRPRKVSDFPDTETLRLNLLEGIREYRVERERGMIVDFHKERFQAQSSFARIGGGSMGGKARGLAFLSHLIDYYDVRDEYPNIEIVVPASTVLCTDCFDEFVETNDLADIALSEVSESEIRKRFLRGRFPKWIRKKLAQLLEIIDYPIAVRSSGMLEDNLHQPFAGIYTTIMLPNNQKTIAERLEYLVRAIKLVYASTYSRSARAYMVSTPYRHEEEKMAVIIQQLIGRPHDERYYPDFSGVARSFNFYAKPPATSQDGIVNVALGLGSYVVEGGEGVRFCPKYPNHSDQFAGVKDYLDYSQKRFRALGLHLNRRGTMSETLMQTQHEFPLVAALEDDTMSAVGSVYSPENDRIYDSIRREGVPLVTFAPVLKHRLFPLAELTSTFLEIGKRGMGRPVELEFAVNYSVPVGKRRQFAPLQMRPLVAATLGNDDDLDEIPEERILCASNKVLGAGQISDIYDVIVVDRENFNRSKTQKIAAEVGRFNAQLLREKRPYLLIGLGRWGSSDPWLGIPVDWEQINGVRAIVETGFEDTKVEPSEGAHFFHNITSMRIPYFTVNPDRKQGELDWAWLAAQAEFQRGELVCHLRFDGAFSVRVNGRENRDVVLKPRSNQDLQISEWT